jgi:hypothetical protein
VGVHVLTFCTFWSNLKHGHKNAFQNKTNGIHAARKKSDTHKSEDQNNPNLLIKNRTNRKQPVITANNRNHTRTHPASKEKNPTKPN